MNANSRGIVIGLGGFMAGGFASGMFELSLWPKAALVAAVSGIVSLVLWVFLRTKTIDQ